MIIESVALKNFRRFKEATFQFGNGFNVLVGKNGTGKTTILESIFILLQEEALLQILCRIA